MIVENRIRKPTSKPIIGTSKGLTTPLGKLLADLIVPVTRIRETSKEAQSTEEVLRAIHATNKRLSDERVRDCVVGSMDVRALYPSLQIEAAAKVVMKQIQELDGVYDGADTILAGVYLATVLPRET